MSLLVVMGSGETAPTMIKAHRAVIARSAPSRDAPAVMLDTTFGFQMNADDLVAKTRQYFAESVGTGIEVATWRTREAAGGERAAALALLGRARWAFAGPGSPTYALRQWRETAVPDTLLDVAGRGGTLVFGSAAACTVGTHTVPVYEIYKAGTDPYWEDGLDLLGALTGIRAVVIPHFDNAEGGHYDTRFCYLGLPRLTVMEARLPDGIGVLGVDEHTVLTIDTEARTAQVGGNGTVTIRPHQAPPRVLTAGEVIALPLLAALLRGEVTDGAADPAAPWAASTTSDRDAPEPEPTSLVEHTERLRATFERGWAARDVEACVSAALDLEAAVHSWRTDSLQSDETDRARRELHAMIVRLGELAVTGARDPADAVRPFVETLLELRGVARGNRDFATADLVRDRLVAAGLEVRDTSDGVAWSIAAMP
jgi:cyanophycinase-like exopeptidase